jgi:hypothetical protein
MPPVRADAGGQSADLPSLTCHFWGYILGSPRHVNWRAPRAGGGEHHAPRRASASTHARLADEARPPGRSHFPTGAASSSPVPPATGAPARGRERAPRRRCHVLAPSRRDAGAGGPRAAPLGATSPAHGSLADAPRPAQHVRRAGETPARAPAKSHEQRRLGLDIELPWGLVGAPRPPGRSRDWPRVRARLVARTPASSAENAARRGRLIRSRHFTVAAFDDGRVRARTRTQRHAASAWPRAPCPDCAFGS